MHTTILPSGSRAHHNGDYSGPVTFVVPGKDLIQAHNANKETTYNVGADYTHVEVNIPMDDLIALVGDWVVRQKVMELEAVEGDVKKLKKLLRAGL